MMTAGLASPPQNNFSPGMQGLSSWGGPPSFPEPFDGENAWEVVDESDPKPVPPTPRPIGLGLEVHNQAPPTTAPPTSRRAKVGLAQDGEVLIAVMGATGSGKTTFINTVSGSTMRISSGLRSCTNLVEVTHPFMLDGRTVTLIDTPGFDDTTKSDTEILRMIALYLTSTYEHGQKLAGVIYIHRITDVRMGGISTRNFRMFRELCGDKTLKNVVILTNMWGDVDAARGAAREHELSTDPLFFQPVLEKGARMMRHDASLESARNVLRFFLDRKAEVLQIQREIVIEKKDILQTRAGGELNKELLEQIRRHQEEMRGLQEELTAAMEAKDEETRREIEYERQKVQEKMQRLEQETQNLSSNFQKEKEELEQRMKDMAEEAKREKEKMQAEYQRQLDMLEAMRRDDANQSREMQAKLAAQIEELKRSRPSGFFQLVGRALTGLFTGRW